MTIFLRHPGTGGVYETADINGDGGEAQALLYESRGWVRTPAAVIAAERVLGRTVDALEDLADEDLADVAVRSAIPVPPDASADELVAALTERFPDPPPPPVDLADVDLDALTKAELAELADQHGIEGVSTAQTKDEMVAALTSVPDDTNTEETA